MAGYGCYCTTGWSHWVSISNYQEGCLPRWIVVHGSWCNGRSRESLIVGERLCGMNFSLVKLLFGIIAKLNAISFRNILYPSLYLVFLSCRNCVNKTVRMMLKSTLMSLAQSASIYSSANGTEQGKSTFPTQVKS